ncbi:F-box/LRR-repeat protein 13-like [Pyrus ussuriensis x Pyrus communis]|uniref:F-box/LRR-repeat protein 13-like n=1 Tax=Pyrus ussuriensis x Pyrus communis TaxID=2448454 RepID=A0A5N5GMQ8_9ROSA|nr:F-box/LRR-repeat protein 13-like [Pyrus ussuriensis x Pyrus communis]
MGSMPKNQERASDRISALPSEVLYHILSFLPTNYAVRTTVLSKRWKNIWTSVPNLYFCDDDYREVNDFTAFVNRFHLHCDDDYYLLIVVELDLCVNHSEPDQNFVLPQNIFMCETLKVLKLQFHFIARPPTSNCFPNLKFLNVDIHHPDVDSVEKVLSYFPVLEDVVIDGFLDDYDVESLDINISAPALKTISSFVNSPKLESLDVRLYGLSNFSLSINENFVVKANIDLPYEEQPSGESADVEDIHQYAKHHDRAIAIFKDICNVKYLFLSAHNLEGDLPAFDNLNQLKLLLQRSPNLEHLVFEHKFVNCSECNEEDFEHEFYPPEIVPISLSSHLKTITVNRYKGTQYEVQLVKYLFNGEVLNKMTISTDVTSDEQKKALFEEFLLFQKGSKTCEVEMQF